MTFRTYFRWSKGVGGERQQLPRCVEIGVRSWFPSRAYMGFYDDDDRTATRQAVDMFGNAIDLSWVYRGGAWVLDEEQIKSS